MELRTCSQSVCVGRTEKKRSSSPGQFPFWQAFASRAEKSPSCGKLDERKGFLPRNEDPFGTGAGSRSVRHFHQQPARGRLHLPAKRREGRGTENRDQKERKALNAAYAPVRQRKKFHRIQILSGYVFFYCNRPLSGMQDRVDCISFVFYEFRPCA